MRMRWLLVAGLALAASPAATAPRDSLDSAARDYVRLQLAIGQKEDGYIDAYYGPEALRTDGKAIAAHSDLAALRKRASALQTRVQNLGVHATGENARRARFLSTQLTA